MSGESSDSGPWLLVEVPDSTPCDFATVFRSSVDTAGLSNRMESPQAITDLPGVAKGVSSLCRAGVTVVLDEFQVCRRRAFSPRRAWRRAWCVGSAPLKDTPLNGS